MTPGAVAAILYSRCRRCDETFELESEPAPGGGCFILAASWRSANGRTYSAALAIDVGDVGPFLRQCLTSLDRRANRA